jgi:hypothetical protein
MRRRRIWLMLATALASGGGAGAAYGYYTTAGSGTASAISGSAQSVTVIAAQGFVSSDLIPGHSADLLVELDNLNSSPVTVTAITQNGPVTASGGSSCTSDSGTEPTLSLGDSGVSVPSQTGLNISVPSGQNIVIHVADGATMDTASATGCQTAAFQIPILVTVQKG